MPEKLINQKNGNGNGKKKWTEWLSVRLGIVVLIISITTFANQIYNSKSNSIKAAAKFEQRFDIACEDIQALKKRVDILEKQLAENNLEMKTSMARIEASLNLILKKLQ